jgi:hypothetical protein
MSVVLELSALIQSSHCLGGRISTAFQFRLAARGGKGRQRGQLDARNGAAVTQRRAAPAGLGAAATGGGGGGGGGGGHGGGGGEEPGLGVVWLGGQWRQASFRGRRWPLRCAGAPAAESNLGESSVARALGLLGGLLTLFPGEGATRRGRRGRALPRAKGTQAARPACAAGGRWPPPRERAR